ncbi:hypothetical protein TNCV_998941 [Trichonephila clavipes]|nr:hypothetical protein TNCV_998941 [Trichonephila clavipes]
MEDEIIREPTRQGRHEMGSTENGYSGAELLVLDSVKWRNWFRRLQETNCQDVGASYGYRKECKDPHSSWL